MSQINKENVIRISKGFMKNYIIPAYLLLAPYRRRGLLSLKTTYDYIYGKHFEISNQPVEDIWSILPQLLKNQVQCSFATPDQHQERHHAKKTYHSLLTTPIPTSCIDFEDLYSQVYKSFFSSKYKKAYLTSYDMAYRIGYNMTPQVLPCKYVYLAAGAYLGAVCLFGEEWISKNEDKKFPQRKEGMYARVERKKFVYKEHGIAIDYFPNLQSDEIEDMLCVFFDVKCKTSIINLKNNFIK